MTKRSTNTNLKKHFTDPDYGITICNTINTVRLVLSYIKEDGKVGRAMPTWVYHSEAGLQTCMNTARAERSRLMALPEFQAYIARTYTDPSGKRRNHVRPRQYIKPEKGVITSLPGLFMRVNTIDPKGQGREVCYVNVVAQGPVPGGLPKLRGWSVRKYGLAQALRLAAEWRCDYVGDLPPTERELRVAETEVRKVYGPILGGLQ